MSKIRIGSENSTLSKLNALLVGHHINQKFPGFSLEFFTKTKLVDFFPEEVDVIVGNFTDFPREVWQSESFYSVLERRDPREVVFFKKQIINSSQNSIQIIAKNSIHLDNTRSFLKEFLPNFLRTKEINLNSIIEDPLSFLKEFMESKADACVVPKSEIDVLLGNNAEGHFELEISELKDYVRLVIKNSLFVIAPLSLCPNSPAEGILSAYLLSNDQTIRNCFQMIENKTLDTIAKNEINLTNADEWKEKNVHVSILPRNYGFIEYIRGKNFSLSRLKESSIDKFHKSEIWPPNAKMAPRQRERVGYRIPENSDLFVSRGYAYPLDLESDPSKQIVWTSGLSTWKDLSNRNIWVHGSNDGLGESEPTKLSLLLGRKINFVKLSHLESDTEFSNLPLISTYQLSSPEIPTDFDPKKIRAAFWRSGTEYEILTSRFPELKNVVHFVSPGSTYLKIKNDLEHTGGMRLFVSLSFEDWQNRNVES